MNSIDKKRYIWVVISALIQGLLLGLYAITFSGPLLCMPLTIIFLVPFVFWLSQEQWGRRLFSFIMWLTLVLLVLWLYRLWSLYSPSAPNTSFRVIPSQKSELIRVSMAVFLIIPFFQCRISAWSWRMPYSEIFFQFCRNIFLLFQAAIVIAVFWGLLVTAGLLFDIVGLDKVPLIMFNPVIAVPLSSLTIAISISVAIRHPGIDSLGRWILSVLAWLLPFFSILSIVFILCLPYSGLQTLWSTGQASTLMLLLQFGTIILANAAWLDGNKAAFQNKLVEFLAKISLLCLPVYTGLCMYSVGIRVAQYGLSVDRVQAVFLVVVTGIWGLGYAGAVLFGKWPGSIGRVNIASVVSMLVIVIAMNSPILDPFRLAAYNQAERLRSGEIAPEDFDYIYTRFNLGRYGNKVLSAMTQEGSEQVKQGVEAAMAVEPDEYLDYVNKGVPPIITRREIISGARVYPEGSKLSAKLVNFFVDQWHEDSSIFHDVESSDDVAFMFAGDEQNVILFTEEMGVIYTLSHDIKPLGVINGRFFLSEVEKIKPVTPALFRILSGRKIYQVLKIEP